MAEKSPELYNLKKITVWFAVASVLLLISLVWMVMQDSIRDWKDYQKKFMAYSRTKAQEELAAAQKKIDQKQLAALEESLKQAHGQVKANTKEMKPLGGEIDRLGVEVTKANTHYQNAKQVLDSDRYFFEEYRVHGELGKAEE